MLQLKNHSVYLYSLSYKNDRITCLCIVSSVLYCAAPWLIPICFSIYIFCLYLNPKNVVCLYVFDWHTEYDKLKFLTFFKINESDYIKQSQVETILESETYASHGMSTPLMKASDSSESKSFFL